MTRRAISVGDAALAILLAGIPAMLALGRPGGALFMTLTGATAVALRILTPPSASRSFFTAALTLASYLIATGGVAGSTIDSAVAHFVLPAALTPVLLNAAVKHRLVAEPTPGSGRRNVGVALIAAALTLAIGAAWEVVEYASDRTFGTTMAPGHADTVRDLLADALGALTGAALSVSWIVRRRR